ncbi:MAG: hypothetical protein NC211_01230 [Alistipes senegalensis]|nr:hypothetical protein [Oxalobacter formigenes]MCM1280448.1 hypothetical protein [Alistipes senegalensis]
MSLYEHAVLILHEDIDSEGINAHLFKCRERDGKPHSIKKTSLCGAVERCGSVSHYQEGDISPFVFGKIASKEFRLLVARAHDKSANICGRCVAHLYADEEEQE